MRIVVLDTSQAEAKEDLWKEFENGYDSRILVVPLSGECAYLKRIWNQEVYCVANLNEAALVIAYLRREETEADAEETTIYL
jgi:hypothetical protein